MVGLGETDEQISVLMDDILATGCDILTIGQYLQPSEKHWKLDRCGVRAAGPQLLQGVGGTGGRA